MRFPEHSNGRRAAAGDGRSGGAGVFDAMMLLPTTPSRCVPKFRDALRVAVAGGGLLLAVLGAGGCRSTGVEEPTRPFDMVRPPVAFEMLRDNPQLPVLDLRSRAEFAGPVGHIQGSRNAPLEELPDRLTELAALKNRTFLVYCGHDDCGLRGLKILRRAGFEEAILMEGGIDHWVLDGFGTVTGPPPPMDFLAEDSEDLVVD